MKRWMKLKFFFMAAFCLVVLYFGIKILSDGRTQLTSQTLTILIGQHYPPYVLDNKNLGIDTLIIQEAFATQGIVAKIQRVPLVQLKQHTNDTTDCVSDVTPQQISNFYESNPYIVYNDAAISLKARNLKIEHQKDLLPYRVNAFQAAKVTLGEEWASLYKSVKKYYEYSDQKHQIKQVLKGLQDVMILDVQIAEHLYASLEPGQKFTDTFTVHEIFPKTYYSIACRKEADVLSFNQGVEKLRASGAYQKIYESFHVAL